MYKMTSLETLCLNLANPYWFTQPLPSHYKIVPGTEGAFNILWAFMGRPELSKVLALQANFWPQALAYSKLEVAGSTLERTATVLTLEEFAKYVDKHIPQKVKAPNFKRLISGSLIRKGVE